MTQILSILLLLAFALANADAQELQRDPALEPPYLIVNPWPSHIAPTQRQGVPGIERTAQGRLWIVYGRDVESPLN